MSAAKNMQAERLDQYVAERVPAISRSSAAKLIERGAVIVNGDPQLKASYRLRSDDTIEIRHDSDATQPVPKIELPVIYEDKDCVVINKPLGILTHSKGAFNPEATVATWLSSRTNNMTGERAGIVHRLDRATSGVMICAKTPEALIWLQKQFSLRKVKKTYVALVEGHLKDPQAVIDMPIERNPKKPQMFRVGSNGKSAVTAYKVLQTSDTASLIELQPTTGRTHQLRVHMKHLGHPIIGDTFYDGKPANRLFLHAGSLEITLPNRQRKVFTVPLPRTFKQAL
jgi:23S rRNA pseudouridine1911/1915/1917 synthase